jgi:choline dehydrogenase-like flavoprotein
MMLADLTETLWDVIVIGTGIGGGTAGRALAESGWRVLFLEKGPAGYRAEETRLSSTMADPVARALRGFWPDPVHATIDGQARVFHAALGAGVGGSSVFYAATLERPARHDLESEEGRPHPTGGWPVTLAEMEPWFTKAETIYQVSGGADPLTPGAPLPPGPDPTPADRAIMDRLQANGLHPYRLHAALRHLPGCAECFGQKCPRSCKMDARSAGVEPALATGRATLLDRAEVTRLDVTGDRVTAVHVIRDGVGLTFRATQVVLAAGALSSPRVLLASKCDHWPVGLANRSGLVGRNLMFHLNEVFALWPGKGIAAGPSKAVGFRDLYFAQGQRLGMVQAMGVDVGYGEVLHVLRERWGRHALGRGRLAREVARIPAWAATQMLGSAKLFVGLLEDLPYADNRVTYDPAHPGRITFDYRVQPELLTRRALFRRLIGRAFRGNRTMFLARAPEPNWGHPCGTLRMGHDPAVSVVDGTGRAHGLANLWVADASVFPTSMGVNPSLTIAAHALRMADAMGVGQ